MANPIPSNREYQNSTNPPTTEHTYWKGELAIAIICLVGGILLGHYDNIDSTPCIVVTCIVGFLVGTLINVGIVELINHSNKLHSQKFPTNPLPQVTATIPSKISDA